MLEQLAQGGSARSRSSQAAITDLGSRLDLAEKGEVAL